MTQSEFLKVVMPFKDKLFRLAKRILISVDEAEDTTQDILLKLWQQKETIKNYTSVEAFAMTMTKNNCFDKLKAKHNTNISIAHNNYKDQSTSIQHQVELKDSVQWVNTIIERLPKQQQVIIQLRDVEAYSLEEISEMLELNNATVRVNLSRARKTIKEQLIKAHNYGVK